MTSRTTSREGRTSAASEPRERSGAQGPPRASVKGGPAGRQPPGKETMTRRELLETMGTMAVVVAASPLIDGFAVSAQVLRLAAVAGPDRVVMRHGKTYLNGWVGYGAPPRRGRSGRGTPPPPAPDPGPAPATTWTKVSGPGTVTFADPKAAVTTATFSEPGEYVLKVTADNGEATASSILTVKAELPPPAIPLTPIATKSYTITSPLWWARAKALMVSWIPHCVDQINRDDLQQGPGGIDNFIEAAKALRGDPHAGHKGYVFSNAWVYQTVEAMSIALMVHPRGDQKIIVAQQNMKATLDDWIPKILAAQESDGYLHTAWTLRNAPRATSSGNPRPRWSERWTPQFRGNHEGYVAGYFIEAAINHYTMTAHKDARLYAAARKLADCWCDNIGPAPKREWFDGHQEMEQALVRFGRFVNQVEGSHQGDRYISLAKFLLDCRTGGTEYDQSHLPVQQQYEAVGHAVRAVYNYSAMADVAVETRDVDYQSAVKSLWESLVHRKYYVTGGVGTGETSEGFGPDYSLRNNSYCEACSSCGEIFFQWKMNLAWQDARYADLYEQTLYNGLLGALDLDGTAFYYTNPLDANANRTPWHNCPCCVGNIPRTILMLPTWAYAKDAEGLYVNLFIGSVVTIDDVAGTSVEMVQATDYPWNGKVSITVNPAVPKRFAVRIRVPNRDVSSLYRSSPDANGIKAIAVNGGRVKPSIAHGYATIARTWRAGDRIELELPMAVQRVHASEKVTANQGRVALRYGPLVYNIEQVDQDINGSLDRSAALTTEWRPELLGGVVVIKGAFADGSPLLAIPNYARYNRPSTSSGRPEPVEGRNPPPPQRPATPPDPGSPRPAPPQPTSIVWMREP